MTTLSLFSLVFFVLAALGVALAGRLWSMRRVFLAIAWTPLASLAAAVWFHDRLISRLGILIVVPWALVIELSIVVAVFGAMLVGLEKTTNASRVYLALATTLAASPAIFALVYLITHL